MKWNLVATFAAAIAANCAIAVVLGFQIGWFRTARPVVKRNEVVSRSDSGPQLTPNGLVNEAPLGDVVQLPPQIVPSDGKFTHRFRVSNPFSEEVVIEEILPSCSCIATHLDSKRLNPGQQVELSVTVSLSKSTIDKKSVSVTLVDSRRRYWKYRLEVDAYPVIKLDSPSTLINLGEHASNASWSKDVPVCVYRTPGTRPYRLAAKSGDGISCAVAERELLTISEGMVCQQFVLHIAGSAKTSGANSTQLLLQADNSDRKEELAVYVTWLGRGPYDVGPSSLRFGYLPDPVTQTLYLDIHRRDGLPFRIVRATTPDKSIKVDLPPGQVPTKSVRISVKLDRSQLARSFYRRIELYTDDLKNPEIGVFASAVSRSPSKTDHSEKGEQTK